MIVICLSPHHTVLTLTAFREGDVIYTDVSFWVFDIFNHELNSKRCWSRKIQKNASFQPIVTLMSNRSPLRNHFCIVVLVNYQVHLQSRCLERWISKYNGIETQKITQQQKDVLRLKQTFLSSSKMASKRIRVLFQLALSMFSLLFYLRARYVK